MRLRKICSHPSLIIEDKENGDPAGELPQELVLLLIFQNKRQGKGPPLRQDKPRASESGKFGGT
jgi:SNF2 family DNA or RNA helicase